MSYATVTTLCCYGHLLHKNKHNTSKHMTYPHDILINLRIPHIAITPHCRYVENDVTTEVGRKWQKQNFLRLTISASAAYTALDHVMYRPFEDYYGPDAIVISADDMGNTGYGVLCMGLEEKGLPCRLTDSITVPVSVTGRPDRIEISVPGGILTGREDTSLSLSGVSFLNHDDLVHNYNVDQRRWDIPRSTNASASEALVAGEYTHDNEYTHEYTHVVIKSLLAELLFL